MANEKANEEAVNDEPLASHSQANEDVGAPGKTTGLGILPVVRSFLLGWLAWCRCDHIHF